VLISVTSPNKLSTRTYVVTLYVLMDDQVTPTLSDLVLDHGELDPEFIPESFKYTVFYDNDRNRVGLRPYSLTGEDIKVCRLVSQSGDDQRRYWQGQVNNPRLRLVTSCNTL